MLHSFITEGAFVSSDPTDRVALLYAALPKAVKVCVRTDLCIWIIPSLIFFSLLFQADNVLTKIRREKREPTETELALIDEAEAMREVIIQVDSFPELGSHEPRNRPALDQI